jgi:hypothetical protein
MKTFGVMGVMTLIASQAFAQTPDSMPPSTRSTATVEADLATPAGHELSAGVASYTYREPGAQAISIYGAKFVADYTGTLSMTAAPLAYSVSRGHVMLDQVTCRGI